MRNNIIVRFFALLFRIALWFRYRIEVKGFEKLNPDNLNKKGGVLFLPNHPAAMIDPAIVTLSVFPKFPIRPLTVEYMYFTTGVHAIMKYLNAIPVPNFESSNNSLKRKRHEKVISEVVKGLKQGENFLLYPAGRLKHTEKEKIGGASGTRDIIKDAPEANIVLVRIKGLWGSSFSRAQTGKVPPLLPTLAKNLWVIFKNLIFFTPRRKVIVELEPAPEDFPYDAERLELNKWLENYYNRPDGLSEQEGEYPGESLKLVSYSMWRKDLPEVNIPEEEGREAVYADDIDEEVREKVYQKLMELTELDRGKIKPNMSLSSDLGMDSLDISELAMFINDRFDTGPIPVDELKNVDKVLGFAAKKIEVEKEAEEEKADLAKWEFKGKSKAARTFEGETMIEVLLNATHTLGNSPACADSRSGILTNSRVRLAVCLLAEYIRHQPGRYIGILLPSTVGAFLCFFAVQLAGKVPVMINWTIGPRHLKSVRELSKVECVLSSWAFLERLNEVDLSGIDDIMVMLETVKRHLGIIDKLRAFIRSKRSTKSLMKLYGIDDLTKDDEAVLLFTSGSESMPKGVPLSHHNVLSNQKAALEIVNIQTDDVLLAILPPFHSFGCCVTGTMGLLSGFRTAYFPDPTDGKGLAKSFETWKATISCGAPTFVNAMLRAAEPEQLESMRICVVGAEKTPQDLIKLAGKLGKKDCLVEGYGVTECSPIVSANFPGKPLRGIGKPLPGIDVIVVHPEKHERLPQGEEGLFLVRGPNVFDGYLNPGLESPFIEVEGLQWYNTGDIGYLDEEGFMFISGRKKRFVKAGGEMVSIQAVEDALRGVAEEKGWEQTEEGPILGIIAKEKSGGRPLMYLICTFDTDTDEINDCIRERGFSNIVKISKVIKVEEIPLMGTGKINYRVLEEQYFESDDGRKEQETKEKVEAESKS